MLKSIYSKIKFLLAPFLLLTGCLFFMLAMPASNFASPKNAARAIAAAPADSSQAATRAHNRFMVLYHTLNLDSLGLSQEAFTYALNGYNDLLTAGTIKNDRYLSIVDFSLPSSKKRLFVIDLNNGKLVFNTLVSHGRGSGQVMATEFSNDLNSFKSSLGFYVTGDTYSGEHGYSLRLQGEEKGINDNAYDRSIVMHAANYVNEAVIKMKGYLGRSLGCPAVPPSLHKAIINTIKDGTCLFLYSPDQFYISHSKMLAQPDSLNAQEVNS